MFLHLCAAVIGIGEEKRRSVVERSTIKNDIAFLSGFWNTELIGKVENWIVISDIDDLTKSTAFFLVSNSKIESYAALSVPWWVSLERGYPKYLWHKQSELRTNFQQSD